MLAPGLLGIARYDVSTLHRQQLAPRADDAFPVLTSQ